MANGNDGEGVADAAAMPKPTVEYVKPKFKRGAIQLPVEIKIPAAIANEAGIGRFLWLEKDSEIPKIALEWLIADARYTGWFTKKQ
jgi:hypothetical protein